MIWRHREDLATIPLLHNEEVEAEQVSQAVAIGDGQRAFGSSEPVAEPVDKLFVGEPSGSGDKRIVDRQESSVGEAVSLLELAQLSCLVFHHFLGQLREADRL